MLRVMSVVRLLLVLCLVVVLARGAFATLKAIPLTVNEKSSDGVHTEIEIKKWTFLAQSDDGHIGGDVFWNSPTASLSSLGIYDDYQHEYIPSWPESQEGDPDNLGLHPDNGEWDALWDFTPPIIGNTYHIHMNVSLVGYVDHPIGDYFTWDMYFPVIDPQILLVSGQDGQDITMDPSQGELGTPDPSSLCQTFYHYNPPLAACTSTGGTTGGSTGSTTGSTSGSTTGSTGAVTGPAGGPLGTPIAASSPPDPGGDPCGSSTWPTFTFSASFWMWPSDLVVNTGRVLKWAFIPSQCSVDQVSSDWSGFWSTGIFSVIPAFYNSVLAGGGCPDEPRDFFFLRTPADYFVDGCVAGSGTGPGMPYNETDGSFQASSPQAVSAFYRRDFVARQASAVHWGLGSRARGHASQYESMVPSSISVPAGTPDMTFFFPPYVDMSAMDVPLKLARTGELVFIWFFGLLSFWNKLINLVAGAPLARAHETLREANLSDTKPGKASSH